MNAWICFGTHQNFSVIVIVQITYFGKNLKFQKIGHVSFLITHSIKSVTYDKSFFTKKKKILSFLLRAQINTMNKIAEQEFYEPYHIY